MFIHPFDGFFRIGTDKEDFLHRVGANVNALYAGRGGILYFETRRGSAASTGDSTGHNPCDIRAVANDAAEQLIQSANAAVFTLDSAVFHEDADRVSTGVVWSFNWVEHKFAIHARSLSSGHESGEGLVPLNRGAMKQADVVHRITAAGLVVDAAIIPHHEIP